MSDLDAVLSTNRAFYRAFEDRDIELMSDVWEHSDRAICVHPGWGRLGGWGAISASFFALFQNDVPLQFILTNERAEVVGDVGWVHVDENILSVEVGGTVAAINLFVRSGNGWRMIAHHGSSVAPTVG